MAVATVHVSQRRELPPPLQARLPQGPAPEVRSCCVPGRGGFQRRSRCSVSPLKGTWHFRGTCMSSVSVPTGTWAGAVVPKRRFQLSPPCLPTRCDMPPLKTHSGESALRAWARRQRGRLAGSEERPPSLSAATTVSGVSRKTCVTTQPP